MQRENDTLATRVRAKRLALKLTQEELARRAGVSQTTIDKIERGQIKRSRYMVYIAKSLLTPMRELDPENMDLYPDEALLTALDHQRNASSWPELPLYSTELVIGTQHKERLLDAIITDQKRGEIPLIAISKTHIDMVPSLRMLVSSEKAYAVYISDVHMAPELEPGDIAYVDPNKPIIHGSTCIFIRNVENNKFCIIGRFVGLKDGRSEIRQWLDMATFLLDRSEWDVAHRIVAKTHRP